MEPPGGLPPGGSTIADRSAYGLIEDRAQLVQGAALGSMMVLNFHCIGRPKRGLVAGEREVCIDRQQFVEILDVVQGRGDVRLTFDDGNLSDVTDALPELVWRGLQAEFFVCPARFGLTEFVDEEGIRELRRAGMSVGSHGMDHVRWRRLAPAEIDREIVAAKQVLEDVLQEPVEAAACPFGAYDRRTLQALEAAAFERVYTSDGGRATSTAWLLPRNSVRRSDSAESVQRLLDGCPETASMLSRAKRWIKRQR